MTWVSLVLPKQFEAFIKAPSIHQRKLTEMLKKTSLVLSLFATTGAFAMSQKASTEQAPVIQATQIKVNEFKTRNNALVWLVENQDIPVISVSFCFKNAGSKADRKGKVGLSDFLSRILNEGCGSLSTSDFKKYLLEHNINLMIDQSADDFIFELRAPKANIKEAFYILKMILDQPRFAADAKERVSQQLFTELSQSLHSEKQIAINLMRQRAFATHPYGHSIENKLQDLPTLQVEDLKAFMVDHFTTDQLVIAASGSIDSVQLADLVETTTNNLSQTRPATLGTIPAIDPITPGTIFVKEMDIPQSSILFFQPSLSRQDPDFYAALILIKILGDGVFDSRLWNEVREKHGLAYNISASLFWNAHSSYLIGATATQNNSVKKVIQIIREQWEIIKKEGVTAKELNATQQKMIGAYPLAFGSTYQIIGMLRMQQLDGMSPNFVNERNRLIEKVTLEDVNRVAQKLLNPEKLTFIVVGNPEDLAVGESK